MDARWRGTADPDWVIVQQPDRHASNFMAGIMLGSKQTLINLIRSLMSACDITQLEAIAIGYDVETFIFHHNIH